MNVLSRVLDVVCKAMFLTGCGRGGAKLVFDVGDDERLMIRQANCGCASFTSVYNFSQGYL